MCYLISGLKEQLAFYKNDSRKRKVTVTKNKNDYKNRKFPAYICLEVTNTCNLRCVHCLYKGGTAENYNGKVGYIDVNLAKNILDQLKPYDSGVMLNGDGEALLHPKFSEIAGHAMALGLTKVFFNTNGTLLKKEFTDNLVSFFKGSISVSLDGFKDSHERIRRGSSYELVFNNIRYLQNRIKETDADIKISVSFCNYDQPVGEREDFVKYWVDRVDSVTVGEVYDSEYKIISNRINKQDNRNRVQCQVPWETFIVRFNGTVVPCSNCFSLGINDDVVLGNAACQRLSEIWNGKEIQGLRHRIESWDLSNTICDKCERWNMYVNFSEREESDGIMMSRTGVFSTFKKIRNG